MGVTRIASPAAGEDLIGIEPELSQQIDPGWWRRRLNLFTGRALSDTALDNEQAYRSGRLALLGQSVTPGTVSGLELAVNASVADPVLTVNAGYGILANGEDVTLLSTLRTALSTLAVLDETGAAVSLFKDFAAGGAAGILLLQPIVAQLNGESLDTAPSSILVSGNLDASCDQDPSEYAFQDLEIVDGCRIGFLPWPMDVLPLPNAALNTATWRNRLAYAIYAAEIALPADTALPWELVGLPLAIAGFDPTGKLLFADRYSVVRQGGLPRVRYVVPLQAGLAQPIQMVQPAVAQARIAQLAEQIVQTPGISSLATAMALLPPAGILPAAAVNFPAKTIPWFPSNWSIQAGPIHLEELESALQTAMTADPLDVTQNESVELLVPLPDAVYDPSILVVEAPDPAFAAAVQAATSARNIDLQHSKVVELAANAQLAATGGTPIDLNAGLTEDEIAARDGAAVYTPQPGDAYGTTASSNGYVSNDLQNILTAAAAAPYTITIASTNPATTIALFSSDDFADLTTNGIQHFIDRINAKLDRADDLINLAFVTAQTDIYRFRQNVLSASDATRLVTSPVLANIASGDSADATAQNISSYLDAISSQTTPVAGAVAAPAPQAGAQAEPNSATGRRASAAYATTRTAAGKLNANVVTNRALATIFQSGATNIASQFGGAIFGGINIPGRTIAPTSSLGKDLNASQTIPATASQASTVATLSAVNQQLRLTSVLPTQQITATQIAGTVDVTAQQPIVGAQLNLRTLSIAERLKQSASQESLFYGVGNRLTILNLLLDLEITIDDLQFFVDSAPATPAPSAANLPAAIATEPHFVFELRKPATSAPVLNLIASPHVDDNSDEAGLFSSGIRVLDQHTQLLRAVEARIQQYRDFISLICTPALTNIQNFLSQAQTALAGLQNDLDQNRQDLAFTNALLADEQARVTSLNAQRAATLSTYVQVVAFVRPRTLDADADVPSRQLIPGNVTSPVPACLGQQVAVPPELREIASLVREAPLSWFPSAAALLGKIERPSLLSELASSVQSRAAYQLQQPVAASSATASSGVYATAIAGVFTANQQVFRSLQVQRASVQPAQLTTLSWAAQVAYLAPVAALADLVSTSIVHAEIANAIARLVQQISSVATCLYTRAGLALPAARLQWAEYLRGPGIAVQMSSLAILPGWNSQPYIGRQQMQLLVDWLFQQIDPANFTAAGYVSDVVRTCILLASHAPVDGIIGGAVSGRTLPVPGNNVTLTSGSNRVAQGMSVQFYQKSQLVAEGVISDLDTATVTATVTKVYQSNVFLEDQSVAHFTAQSPTFAALKAFAQ
ncbi:MAG TPA: hypothetical protein VHX20_09945 [Terracidiphilus sp.]|jgi:hypothetical protein|nr:hypothetical protein [Terracidiphilus sp.]